MEQSKEIKQNWTGAENFDNCFCVISDCYYKFCFWKEDLALGTIFTQF